MIIHFADVIFPYVSQHSIESALLVSHDSSSFLAHIRIECHLGNLAVATNAHNFSYTITDRGLATKPKRSLTATETIVIFQTFITYSDLSVGSMQYVLIIIHSIISGNEEAVAKFTVVEDEPDAWRENVSEDS